MVAYGWKSHKGVRPHRKGGDLRGDFMINEIKEQTIEKARFNLEDGETLENAVQLAIDDIIYDDDLWEIMMEYQRPQDANLDEALNFFYSVVYEEIKEGQND